MYIVLCGYGRMGKTIASLVSGEDTITERIDPFEAGASARELLPEHAKNADVVIEFSHADVAPKNLKRCMEYGIPVVIGTTGWDISPYKSTIERAGIAGIWASNFSIGAYITRTLAVQLARSINNIPDYDIMLHEYHHKLKKDSPSGTALSIAQGIIDALERKTQISSELLQNAIAPEVLHVSATRGGAIPGTHTVTVDSIADSITLTHTARDRTGFALGALYAARWIRTKTAGLYTIDDYMQDLLSKNTHEEEQKP